MIGQIRCGASALARTGFEDECKTIAHRVAISPLHPVELSAFELFLEPSPVVGMEVADTLRLRKG